MGKSVLARLDRCYVVERMTCGIPHPPSGLAGKDLLLRLVYLCVCVHVPSGVGMCAWCSQACVHVTGVAWGCVCLCLGLHADSEHRDLALVTQQHKALSWGQLHTGTRMVWCKLMHRNPLLSSASSQQAGIWPWCSHWGLRRGLVCGQKKLGGGTNRRHSCLLHQPNFNI